MKINKDFTVTAADGRIVYTTGPTVPMSVKLRAMTLFLNGNAPDEDKDFEVSLNDEVIIAGRGKPGERRELETPLRLEAGKQIFKLTSGPFKDGEVVSGEVEIEVSFF